MILGFTKDVGFQFGIRKTLPVSKENVWRFLFSKSGLITWLGEILEEIEIGKSFKTKDGVEIFVRVFHPFSHIRLDWKKKEWDNFSRIQIRVIEKGSKTTIRFHQEKLIDSKQRKEMKEYWTKVINKISDQLYE